MQPIIDKLPDTLTAEQRQQAIALICRNTDVFSKHEFDVSCTDLLTARIQIDGHRPIAKPLKRHARVHLDVIDEPTDCMKAAGIVEDAVSPLSRSSILFDELTFTLGLSWSAGRPDHVTAAAWPRFGSRTVSLTVLVADSSSIVLNMLCGFFVFDVRSRTLHTYFVFFVNTFYIET